MTILKSTAQNRSKWNPLPNLGLSTLKGLFRFGILLQQKKVELEEEEINPNVEDPELKMSEMIKLFGDPGAHEILAMETEMQLKFEKVKDAQSAKLWPCLPINMKFDF